MVKEQTPAGLESEECVPVERHVYPRTVVSLSQHNNNPIKGVGLVQSGLIVCNSFSP